MKRRETKDKSIKRNKRNNHEKRSIKNKQNNHIDKDNSIYKGFTIELEEVIITCEEEYSYLSTNDVEKNQDCQDHIEKSQFCKQRTSTRTLPKTKNAETINNEKEEGRDKENIKQIPINQIPINIFQTKLSGLQAITFYLKNKGLTNKEIANKLNRSQKTIWSTIKQIKEKIRVERSWKDETEQITQINEEEFQLKIPINLFANRRLSIGETIVWFLKRKGFANHEIAELLSLDPRTTWTLNKRAEKKEKALSRTILGEEVVA